MHPSEEALTDYIDGALDTRERGEIDRHLESCATCRRLVDDSREIKSVAASLELREPPIRSWMRLERAIKLEGRPGAAAGAAARFAWAQPRRLASAGRRGGDRHCDGRRIAVPAGRRPTENSSDNAGSRNRTGRHGHIARD